MSLKDVLRLAYGDALPHKDDKYEGYLEVFRSNTLYPTFSQANTRDSVVMIGMKGSYKR